MLKVLFLCTGNSCRSQMAEGWARRLKSDRLEAYSAGIETHGLNPDAVRVMAEAGVDISSQRSKHVSELCQIQFDYVVTVCDRATSRVRCFLEPRKPYTWVLTIRPGWQPTPRRKVNDWRPIAGCAMKSGRLWNRDFSRLSKEQ